LESNQWVSFVTDAGAAVGEEDYGFIARVFDAENNTPQIKLPSIWKIMSGCASQTLDLSPIDLDGDTIKCFWATSAEAVGAYRGNDYNSISLDSETCILTYDGTADSGKNGAKPIVIQVQDFDVNGVMRSSMPIQFLATVWTPTNPNFRSDMEMDVASKGVGIPFVYEPSLFQHDY